MWLWLGVVAAAITATGFCLLSRRSVRPLDNLKLALQHRGMRVASWVVGKAYNQVDGLESVEAVVECANGHEICVQILNPNLPRNLVENNTTVCDFVRIIVPPEEVVGDFKIVSARLSLTHKGEAYVMRFSNTQLHTLLGVVLESFKTITVEPADGAKGLENRTLQGMPVRAHLSWIGIGGNSGVHHKSHDVLPAIARLVGPKSRWWHLSDVIGSRPAHRVTCEHIIAESLRHVYGLTNTSARFMRHLLPCQVSLSFVGIKQPFIFDLRLYNTDAFVPPHLIASAVISDPAEFPGRLRA